MNDLDTLAGLMLFRDVPRRALEELLILAPPVRFMRGQTVFHQGAPSDVALLVLHGRLEASIQAGTSSRVLGDIRPGEIVGEQGLLIPGGERSATVTARDDTSCLLLSPNVMDHAARNTAIVALERHLLGTLARRIRSTNLAIQQAWKAETPSPSATADAAPPARLSLGQRLASLFGGR